MFSFRRLLSLSAIAAMLCLTLLAISTIHTSTAHAASANAQAPMASAVTCTTDGCDGKSPVSTGCSGTALVTHQAAFSTHGGGYTEFVFSATCHAAWGFIHFNTAMASGHTGDAGISNGYATYLCEDGNGVVAPGQTSCYTAMVGDGSSETAAATGFYDTGVLSVTAAY
jgi:hypothetical protein